MKKYSFIISAFVLLALVSCDSKKEAGAVSDATKKNLEAHRAIAKSFETGDFSKIGDYIAEDAVDYAGEQGPVTGLANIKAEFEKMKENSMGMKSETVKELADDDYVMAWMKFSGTMQKDAMGMKKGQSYNMEAIEVSKYRDGKVTAHWTFMQPSEMMKMMGGGGQMPMDTTQKIPKDTTSK